MCDKKELTKTNTIKRFFQKFCKLKLDCNFVFVEVITKSEIISNKKNHKVVFELIENNRMFSSKNKRLDSFQK